jgi:hypothetical protein|tara:strand:+ start:542 stop:778 length:237 start_codon:yes stop_codon:yes gene_type:complete
MFTFKVVFMSSPYKENNFSTETILTARTTSTKNIKEVVKPNIEHLIKKIRAEKRREKKINIIIFGTIFLSVALVFYFF